MGQNAIVSFNFCFILRIDWRLYFHNYVTVFSVKTPECDEDGDDYCEYDKNGCPLEMTYMDE